MAMLKKSLVLCAAVAAAAFVANRAGASAAAARVQLCDGETQLELTELPDTPAGGMAVASALMAEWRRKNPGQSWAMGTVQDPDKREQLLRQRYQPKAPFDNRGLIGEGQKAGHPYRDFSERDIVLWERETMRLVFEGAETFHDAKKLGSTIAVSCDMCHPDASNTHPETYPKYQTQIGRPVMLREMINWCIEHPLRGKPLAHDDPRMLAMEAYIHAQRAGATLQFGKH
jgi:thiosulfate dehydrogenase